MSYLRKGENGENGRAWELGKLKKHQKPIWINGKIVKMSCAGKRGRWGKWESLGNEEMETPSKHQKKKHVQ